MNTSSSSNSASQSLVHRILDSYGVRIVYQPNMTNNQAVDSAYDIQVLDPTFYDQVLQDGSLGLGESFVQGKWISYDLIGLMNRLARLSEVHVAVQHGVQFVWSKPRIALAFVGQSLGKTLNYLLSNQQTIHLSKRVAQEHYDIPTVLYKNMLDSRMQYSCAFWSGETKNLEDAQLNKIQMIVSKLQIEDGKNVIDVGCGFGGLVGYIAQQYPNSQVYGVCNSQEQFQTASNKYAHLTNAHFILSDYRNLDVKSYNLSYLVSVGAFEHFGYPNYQRFFDWAYSLLNPNGIALIHTITSQTEAWYPDSWIDKHIFPGGRLPCESRVIKHGKAAGFQLEDVHGFGLYYAQTLKAWQARFHSSFADMAQDNPAFFNDTFYRKWIYYLSICQSAFLSKTCNLHQFVFSKQLDHVYVRPAVPE